MARRRTAGALWKRARGRKASIKAFIMDARSVVGVGNIYASEALFRAGIRPGTAAGRISRARMAALGIEVAGGTPDSLQAEYADELAKWGKVIRDAKLKFE